MSRRARLAVLASGSGTNLQAVMDAVGAGRLRADIVLVASDKPAAFALERARTAGIHAEVLVPEPGEQRSAYDSRLAELVEQHTPDWVVLAGWMRLLTMAFLGAFPNRVVNLHPALPGCFPGTHAIERAHAAFAAGTIDRTGAMVHLVPDEGVDDGPVLASRELMLRHGEPLAALEARMHALEHQLLVDTLVSLCNPVTAHPLEER